MVHSVCLRRYDISDHIQVYMKQVELVLYARAAALNFQFVNKVDPDQAALVRAAWSWSTMLAYGDMKCLIIHKWNLYARVAALNFFVHKMDLDQAAPVRTA